MAKKPFDRKLKKSIKASESGPARYQGQEAEPIRSISENFKRLADRSLDAIYHYDIQTRRFPFYNRLFLELFGIEGKDGKYITKKSTLLRIHPDEREKVKRATRDSLTSDRNMGEVEYRFLHPDGSLRWMHDRWIIIRDTNGQPQAIEGFIRDNTERRQMEEELEQSRRNALIGRYIIQDGRFLYVNQELIRITGYTEDELLGRLAAEIVHEDFRSFVGENSIKMLKGERSSPYEFCCVTKSNEVKWIIETVTPIRYGGRRAVLGYFMDITKNKQAEEEQREKERLQAILEKEKAERMAAIGRVVAGMAHYIKNILSGLRGGAFIIDHAIRKENLNKLKEGWDMVGRNLKYLSNIVQNMLIYSTDRRPVCRSVNPNALALDVLELMRDIAKLSNVSLVHKLKPGLDNLDMDPTAMHRCLLNLICNAIDACMERDKNWQGVVTVTTDRPKGWGVRFRVKDNGVGMDRKTQQKIFEDFFSTKGYKGTGLGLPVTQKIIEEHQGKLSLSSQLGKGTTFTVLLPG